MLAVRFVDAFLGADAARATCKNDDGGEGDVDGDDDNDNDNDVGSDSDDDIMVAMMRYRVICDRTIQRHERENRTSHKRSLHAGKKKKLREIAAAVVMRLSDDAVPAKKKPVSEHSCSAFERSAMQATERTDQKR